MSLRDREVLAWCARDHARALLPVDHEIIESTASVRANILELIARGAPDRDLFSACSVLGRLIAERGGSPTLACSTMDGAREVSEARGDAPWLLPARASLAEGFAAARLDLARREAAASWEYPRCAVALGDGETIAIVAGFPADDGEALAGWASRVAQRAALAGVRRAMIGAPETDPNLATEARRAAIAEALQVAGIELASTLAPKRGSRG